MTYAKIGQIREHVIVAERALGRPLPPRAHIHHVDGDGQNNANRNLVICQDIGYHKLLHVRTKTLLAGGDPNTQRVCSVCKVVKSLTEFRRASADKSYGTQSACRDCQRAYRRKTWQKHLDRERGRRARRRAERLDQRPRTQKIHAGDTVTKDRRRGKVTCTDEQYASVAWEFGAITREDFRVLEVVNAR